MESIEQVQEWLRLKQLYAQMSEGELQSVADEGYELSRDCATSAARRDFPGEVWTFRLGTRLQDISTPSDLNLVV